jgi:P-type E1-E2 ATPase
VDEAQRRGLVHEERHSKVEYIVAHGIASTVTGDKVVIGSRHFVLEDEGAAVPDDADINALPAEYSHLYLAIGGRLAAVICIEDPLRAEAADVVKKLHVLGITKVCMMTGDNERTARAIADSVGVDEYHAEVLPEDKAAFVRAEHEAGRKVIMVGDGVNDSPALSEADAGIAIAEGAAIAREVADITVSSEDLTMLLTLRELSLLLMRRIDRNYRFIIGFNLGLILLGAFGVIPPTTSALLHNSSTILLSLDSMRDLLQ